MMRTVVHLVNPTGTDGGGVKGGRLDGVFALKVLTLHRVSVLSPASLSVNRLVPYYPAAAA